MISLEIGIILVLILINGFFAAAEIAVVSSRKIRLQTLAGKGDPAAHRALQLVEDPNRFLASVQIGITLVGTLASAFGGARVAIWLAEILGQVPLLTPVSTSISLAIVVLAITYLSLVIGELVPKRLALLDPETHVRRIARFFQVFLRLVSPAVHLLTWSSRSLVLLIVGERENAPEITEADIEAILKAGTREGVLDESEHHILQSVLDLSDTQVRMIMVPRTAIVGIDAELRLGDVISKIAEHHLTRMPVYRGDLDHIAGIVNIQDLIDLESQDLQRPIEDFVRPALFVTEGMSVMRLLETFKRRRSQMAIVLDEYSGTAGLVTLEDVLEEIVGELSDEYDDIEPEILQSGVTSWVVDGLTSIDHLKEELGIDHLAGEKQYHFETVAGFVLAHLGDIPKAGHAFNSAGYHFEVSSMERNRVSEVIVTRLPRRGEKPPTTDMPVPPDHPPQEV